MSSQGRPEGSQPLIVHHAGQDQSPSPGRSKAFPRRVDAERFLIQLEQAKLRGAYVDPAAGRALLREYGEKWRVNQVQHRLSTRARVEGDLRKHLYPALGGRR